MRGVHLAPQNKKHNDQTESGRISLIQFDAKNGFKRFERTENRFLAGFCVFGGTGINEK